MSLRPLFLLTLPILATLLAPRDASACTPPYGFTIEHTYPDAGSVDVPIDGVVLLLGVGWPEPMLEVVVKQGEVEVAGVVMPLDDNHHVWRSAAPLLPSTEYTVHIVSGEPEFGQVVDVAFTTGDAPAPLPGEAVISSVVPEAWELEQTECVRPHECFGCEETKVVGVEHRLRVQVSVADPGGPFAGANFSRIAFGPSADALEYGSKQYQDAGGGAMQHTIDLGVAGEWPGDEVCVRGDIVDPLGVAFEGEVSCVDVSALNVAFEDETDTAPTTGDDSNSHEDPSEHLDYEGCACRSNDAPLGSAALLLGLGLLLRPRRRAR